MTGLHARKLSFFMLDMKKFHFRRARVEPIIRSTSLPCERPADAAGARRHG
jgi:hypothetical protein